MSNNLFLVSFSHHDEDGWTDYMFLANVESKQAALDAVHTAYPGLLGQTAQTELVKSVGFIGNVAMLESFNKLNDC